MHHVYSKNQQKGKIFRQKKEGELEIQLVRNASDRISSICSQARIKYFRIRSNLSGVEPIVLSLFAYVPVFYDP